jgi:hypothetical protein
MLLTRCRLCARGAGEITVTYIVQTAALFATLYAAIILMRFA